MFALLLDQAHVIASCMSRAGYKTRRFRPGVILLVAVLHILAGLALVRAFAPDFTQSVVRNVTSVLTVTVTPPPPNPAPTPSPSPTDAAPEEAGEAGAAGKKARPKEVAAPEPEIEIAKSTAPQVAAEGDDVTSGARDKGEGTGAGGEGSGTGSGTGGEGQGAGGGTDAVKIAGDINSARDYPRESRDLRIGDHVIVALTVGKDGRVKNCRVHRPSRDPEADRITCQLASERFRFRPATNSRGEPMESVFGWKQSWFYTGKAD